MWTALPSPLLVAVFLTSAGFSRSPLHNELAALLPPDASHARIDALAPGLRGAWIRGDNDLAPGPRDHWLLRLAGQPVARFDVILSTADSCYCRVVPLAAELPMLTGHTVERWPTQAQIAAGACRSAVALVREQSPDTFVWIAAPPDADVPPVTHVEFFRGPIFVGHGVVEERDDRFWYVRLILSTADIGPALASKQPPRPSDAVTPPSPPSDDSPTTQPAPRAPQVGDDAIIRTWPDIHERRYVARIFDVTAEGALITAGEPDGLVTGDRLELFRGAELLGEVVLVRVQAAYSVARPAAGATALSLQRHDLMHPRPAGSPSPP